MTRNDCGVSAGFKAGDLALGDQASEHRSVLELRRPIENGIIKHWDDMEVLWDHTFKKLGIEPREHKVVQTEAALNPRSNRERMVETMFEKFGFQAVNVSVQAILALNSQGLTTGFVVDAGDGVTHLVPITEGFVEPARVERVNLAGRHVTEQLMKLLVGSGHALNSTADFETVREVKERLCYVALEPEAERRLGRETTLVDRKYTLPDSREMRIGSERFLAPEILFNPAEHGRSDGEGLAGLVFDAVRKSELDVQKDYFAHILLSGGTTMFPGFSSRLEKDLRALYLENVLRGDRSRAAKFRCNVEDSPRRQHMVFMGGSMMAAAYEEEANSRWWISRREYDEQGAKAVHRLIPTKLGG